MRWLILLVALVGCDDGGSAGALEPEAPEPEARPEPPDEVLVVPGGEVSGAWCGWVRVEAPITVPAGASLSVCAGSRVIFEPDQANGIAIVGDLVLAGSAGAPVILEGDGAWRGLRVGGTLDAAHFEVHGASTCVEGLAGGRITLDHGLIEGCTTPLATAVGATLTHTRILGGGSVQVTGGILDATDTLLDLQHATRAPDCTRFNGGGARLSHVRFTGCHCPLHFDAAPEGLEVTDSVFDGAVYPVMLARTTGSFHRNNFAGTADHFLDIGGNFAVDIQDNWYEGAAPRLSSGDLGQFSGGDGWAAAPFADAGPRGLDAK